MCQILYRVGYHLVVMVLVLAGTVLMLAGCASLKDINLGDIYDQGASVPGLDEATVVAGLKQALQVGSENTVLQTSRVDGFLNNELIKIEIPSQLDPLVTTLRKVGLGSMVADLEVGMNRAAESASSQGKSVFWKAITTMSVEDAFAILRGSDSAATDYFRSRTGPELRERFLPIVHETVQEVGLAQLFGQVLDSYNAIPLTDKPEVVDLDSYVTDRTLDGLFTVLAAEELKIRQDPVARTTDLLRQVFGKMAKK